jgi:hypothetical protein
VQQLQDRLGEKTSTHGGRTITHTTRGERKVVWLMLVAVVAIAVAGVLLFGGRR